MKLVEVIPIARGVGKETLSYFTGKDVAEGSVVLVPLRNRMSTALVTATEDVSAAKAKIRSLRYAIKKVEQLKSSPLFLPEFIAAAKEMAEYCAGTTGGVLSSLVPKVILENARVASVQKQQEKTSGVHETFILHADRQERMARYRSRIREAFARKESVFFTLPGVQDVLHYRERLNKGIENYTFALHGSLPKKELLETWKKILAEPHPVLVIATGAFLSLPRRDIATHILENETSRAYKGIARPYVDVRTFIGFLSKRLGTALILGGALLRAETIVRYKNDELLPLSPPQFRLLSPVDQRVVDMREHRSIKNAPFSALGRDLTERIERSKTNNEHLFLFTLRRGIAPITLCGDCGNTVLCEACSAPVVLHASKKENVFLCHACGRERDPLERCKNCDSWKLVPLGIGIERVEEEVERIFHDAQIFRIDRDNTGTHRQVLEVMEKYLATPGGILLGTEMALPYFDTPIEHAAIVSMDSLFAIPDFRAHEKILDIILKIRSFVTDTLLIQTRNPEENILGYALSGNSSDFYRTEIAMREKLHYPPFVTLIKISVEGTPAAVQKELSLLSATFAEYNPQIFPAFVHTVRGNSVAHALIRVPRDRWPDPELLAKLRSLPPHLAVNVNPESVL